MTARKSRTAKTGASRGVKADPAPVVDAGLERKPACLSASMAARGCRVCSTAP